MILDCYFSLYTYPISALEMCLCPDNDTCSCPRKGIRRQSCLAYIKPIRTGAIALFLVVRTKQMCNIRIIFNQFSHQTLGKIKIKITFVP